MVRDNLDDGALEVLMVKRNQNISFAGGAYVFPGGKADLDDQKDALHHRSFPIGMLQSILYQR